MTDERNDNVRQPGVYDDDRLLACALGLDDDPELLASAAADAVLAARLDAVRADVEHIGAQVSAAVPEPDESYTDLSGERWSGLSEFFQAPTAAVSPRHKRRWWQVAAPVAAVLVVALIVGIVAAQNGGLMPTGGSGSSPDSAQVEAGAGPGATQSYGATGAKNSTPDRDVTAPSLRDRFTEQLDRFAVVVLARARQVSGAVQKFAVLRIFKGRAPKVVELAVGDDPADQGRLHLLMLEPTAAAEPKATPEPDAGSQAPLMGTPETGTESPLPAGSPSAETPAPEPIPTLAAADGPGEPLAVAYTYNGEPTMVRELAAGTDPDAVSLQIP